MRTALLYRELLQTSSSGCKFWRQPKLKGTASKPRACRLHKTTQGTPMMTGISVLHWNCIHTCTAVCRHPSAVGCCHLYQSCLGWPVTLSKRCAADNCHEHCAAFRQGVQGDRNKQCALRCLGSHANTPLYLICVLAAASSPEHEHDLQGPPL